MVRGWFDLFRDNGGPTIYAYSNRTSVIGDSTSITLYIVFATLFLAFFAIFPGIRKERFTTFLSVTLSLVVGVSILIGTCANGWHTAEAEISTAYKSFSSQKIRGKLGIYIGLTSLNVTLEAMPTYYNRTMDVNFNEQFGFERPTQLQEEFKNALKKGLPYPILTVAEYISVDAEGFCWGRTYRQAGYFTYIFLWTSFVLWILMNLLLVVVPRYGAYTMASTGLMMLFSSGVYYSLLPSKPLQVHIDQVVLHFQLGWCFWLIIISGSLCVLVGSSISIIDLMYPHKFSTVLEMDYGTPFDRHTIIEDSHETKKKKKWVPKLDEPAGGVGIGGLLRRFSKRDANRGTDRNHRHPGGTDNFAFEMDAPKSPWRYPHLMFRSESRKNKAVSFKNGGMQHGNNAFYPSTGVGTFGPMGRFRRTDSKDSSCSSMSSVSHQRDTLRPSSSVPALGYNRHFKLSDSSESTTSGLTSFGFSLLSRNGSNKNIGLPPHAHHAAVSKALPHPLAQSYPPENGSRFQRQESSDSVLSRGFTVNRHSASSFSGVEEISTESGGYSSSRKSSDEIKFAISSRKTSSSNSANSAKRRSSSEQKHDEADMW